MILSFLTMYRSAKKSTFIASRFPRPTLCWSEKSENSILSSPRSTDPASNAPQSDQICSLFSNMAQFPGRVKILKQYLLSEMDTVENNIFTLNI